MEKTNLTQEEKIFLKIGKSKETKLLFVDVIFLILDFFIAFLMFKLWHWLFVNKTILTILIIITLFGLIKQTWKAMEDIESHWKLYKSS